MWLMLLIICNGQQYVYCLINMINYVHQIIANVWCRYVSVNQVIIRSDNDFPPVYCQFNTYQGWLNPRDPIPMTFESKYTNFLTIKYFWNVFCKIAPTFCLHINVLKTFVCRILKAALFVTSSCISILIFGTQMNVTLCYDNSTGRIYARFKYCYSKGHKIWTRFVFCLHLDKDCLPFMVASLALRQSVKHREDYGKLR